jgi:hypothetical protein
VIAAPLCAFGVSAVLAVLCHFGTRSTTHADDQARTILRSRRYPLDLGVVEDTAWFYRRLLRIAEGLFAVFVLICLVVAVARAAG